MSELQLLSLLYLHHVANVRGQVSDLLLLLETCPLLLLASVVGREVGLEQTQLILSVLPAVSVQVVGLPPRSRFLNEGDIVTIVGNGDGRRFYGCYPNVS